MPSTTPASSKPRPRTIDPAALGRRGLQLPESWLRGILAGAEGVLGTWLLVVVPAIAVYIATAAAPELGSASWLEAARLGTGVWLAGHGAHLQVGEVTFTLLPLGVSLMAVALTAAAIRRAALETWGGVALAVGTYLAGTLLLVKVAGVPGGGRAAGGALIIALAAAACGMRKKAPRLSTWVRERIGASRNAVRQWLDGRENSAALHRLIGQAGFAIRAGSAASARLLTGILTLGAVGVVASLVVGMPLIRAVHERLETDVVSTIVLTGAQVLMVPMLIIWAASYLSGAGFALGQGTLYSPGEVLSAPLPAVPVLGALPNPESATLPALGYVYLLLGGLAGWYLHRRVTRDHVGEAPLALTLAGVAVAVALTSAAVFLLATLTSGGFGPGRFAADVGPLRGAFAWAVAWQSAATMTAVVVASHPWVHRGVRRGWQKVTGLVGRGDSA